MPDAVSAVDTLRQTLRTAANAGGGWPYYAGKASRIEPTAWALLAFGESWSGTAAEWTEFAAPHLHWLSSVARRDGLLVDQPAGPPNFTANGVAACVLAHLEQRADRPRDGGGAGPPEGGHYGSLLTAIAGVKGVAVKAVDSHQDSRLQGWPWLPDTFSWIEPTAWCALALKKGGAGIASAGARIDEAERLIVNRTCEGGGWNYGNASIIGQDLRPYVPTTAVAIMAMQDRRDTPEIARSVAWLEHARLSEPSGGALALASISLRLAGRPAADVDERLAGDTDRALRIGNLHAMAMMVYALTAERHRVRALRVTR